VEPVTADLVAFLNARYDEDLAAAARDCDQAHPQHDVYHPDGHEPAPRVAADIAAKRAVLALHHPDGPGPWQVECAVCAEEVAYRELGMVAYPCQTVRILASVYADHADYRPEWKP
jgi:hypothetical protein